MSTPTKNPPVPGVPEASGGDRGQAGSQNLKQSREIGQDDPLEGGRLGREANKPTGYPGEEGLPSDAPGGPTEAQTRADDLQSSEPRTREEAIRQAAYERYLRRGGEAGDETDDWLEAERTVDQQRPGRPEQS